MTRLALELHLGILYEAGASIYARSLHLDFGAKRLQKLGIMCTGWLLYVKQNHEVISIVSKV